MTLDNTQVAQLLASISLIMVAMLFLGYLAGRLSLKREHPPGEQAWTYATGPWETIRTVVPERSFRDLWVPSVAPADTHTGDDSRPRLAEEVRRRLDGGDGA